MRFNNYLLFSSAVCALFALAIPAVSAAEPFISDAKAVPKPTKASYAPQTGTAAAAADLDTLVFTSPPRESPEAGAQIYGPIAAYLTKVLGKRVRYHHPGTWGAYRSEMLKGSYDIVFDGPHFNSYRVEKLNHNVLAKLPERHEFVVIVRKDENYTSVSQMGGRLFCSQSPPNLGALILLSQFTNPARQPAIVPTEGWDLIYKGVVEGHCTGGILPLANLVKFDKDKKTKIVYKTPPLPNQAFSAGPRVSLEDQAKIAAALTSTESVGPTANLRAAFKGGERLTPSDNAEYSGIAHYLRSEWGYY